MVFVSSYEQCPLAIASFRRVFQSHASLRVIGSSLEQLQYYRLKYEFDQICYFTGALEQLQIAQLLGEASQECTTRANSKKLTFDAIEGPLVASHYSRALIGKLTYVSNRSQSWESPEDPLRNTLAGAKAFSNIHRAIAESNAQAFVSEV